LSCSRAVHSVNKGIGGQKAASPQRLLGAQKVPHWLAHLFQRRSVSSLLDLLTPEISQFSQSLRYAGRLRPARPDLFGRAIANQTLDARGVLVPKLLQPFGLGMTKGVVRLHLVQVRELQLRRLANQRRDALPCSYPCAVEAGTDLDRSRCLLRLGNR
jgi:hypothetical protein